MIKVIVIGSSGVGKTCFVRTFKNGTGSTLPTNPPATIGMDVFFKKVNLDGENVVLDIWDTSGEEKYCSQLLSNTFRNADGVIIMYDTTRHHTFREVNYWTDHAKCASSNDNLILFLVGNKADKESSREVVPTDARKLAKYLHMEFYEASSFEIQTVDDIFMNIAKKCVAAKAALSLQHNSNSSTPEVSMRLTDTPKEQKVPWYKKC
uniref:Putative ras-related in brain n=1 Tax=Ornithodoros turicata TaxID=34597 RepID=A0A2R5L7X2_9ACAR